MTFKFDPTVPSFQPLAQQQLPSGNATLDICPRSVQGQRTRIWAEKCPPVAGRLHEHLHSCPTPLNNDEENPKAGPVIDCSSSRVKAQACEEVIEPEAHAGTKGSDKTGGKARRKYRAKKGQPLNQTPRSQGRYAWKKPRIWPIMEFGDQSKRFDMEPFIYRNYLKKVLEEDRELADKRRSLPPMPDMSEGKNNTLFGSCFPEILDLRPEILLSQHGITHQTSKRTKTQKQVAKLFDHEWIIIYRENWNRRCVDRYRALCNILGPGGFNKIEKNWQRGHFHQFEHHVSIEGGKPEFHVPQEFFAEYREAIVRRMRDSSPGGTVGDSTEEDRLVNRYYFIMRSFFIMPTLLYPDETRAGLFNRQGNESEMLAAESR